jgi:ABC-type multidrug transport system fused ATPase/permease subunit
VLILDEATSALDNRTQRHITEGFASLNCTRIVIAHRLSTVRQADRIVVIDGGHIAEMGTYDDLMGRNGPFMELVERQRLSV